MDENCTEKFIRRENDRELLRERAEKLARKVAESGMEQQREGATARDYVIFTMGGGSYGIETAYVKEVMEPEEVVPVPCTPDFIAGVVSVRGQVWAVIDICRFWGTGSSLKAARPRILLLGDGEREFGLAIDEVIDVLPFYGHEHKPFAEGQEAAARYASGVTEDRTVLLRGRALLKEQVFVVNDFVGNT